MRTKLLFLLLSLLVVACAESNINEISSPANTKRIYASISDIEGDLDAETRVELNESKQTVWTENDDIYIFEDGYIYVYTFDGKTGDRSGSFSHTRSYSYQPFGAIFDKYYAVHLADRMIASFNDNTPAFFTTLPAEQHYKSHSYGVNTNAMLGSSTNGTDFEFKNLYGYLRLALTGNKVVKSIIIEGNNNETLAAQIYINREGNFSIRDKAPTSTTITLNCGNGVQLTDKPTEFYFTILPTTFQNGISVTVNFTDGTVFPKSTTKSITVNRNTIQPMKCFDTGEIVWQTVSILHTGSKIYTPHIYGSSALSGYIYWGDDYMSDINSVPSYVYDDGKESHTVTIKSMGASIIEIDNCQGISEIDLTNF